MKITNFEVTEIVAPAHWAPYLINGDASGLADEEEYYVDRCFSGYYVVGTVEDEAFFGRFDGTLCDLLTYQCHEAH